MTGVPVLPVAAGAMAGVGAAPSAAGVPLLPGAAAGAGVTGAPSTTGVPVLPGAAAGAGVAGAPSTMGVPELPAGSGVPELPAGTGVAGVPATAGAAGVPGAGVASAGAVEAEPLDDGDHPVPERVDDGLLGGGCTHSARSGPPAL